jgi:hypothetical protein
MLMYNFCCQNAVELGGRKWWENGEDFIMRSLIIFRSHRILLGGKIKENEIGGTCSMRGRNEKCVQNFGRKT